jgi:hypothetical protein
LATNSVFWAALPVLEIFAVAARFLPEFELRTTTALAGQAPSSGAPQPVDQSDRSPG